MPGILPKHHGRTAVLFLVLVLMMSFTPVCAEETGSRTLGLSISLPGSFDTETDGDVSVLPLDFSGGMPLKKEFFTGTLKYEDPTISVTVQRGTASLTKGNCVFWVATIKIQHASQLRTMAANGFQSGGELSGEKMAKRVNAVLAINGDTYNYTGHGLIVRQGKKYLDALQGDRDVLVVDEDGDFHIVEMADRGDIGATIKGKKVINTFFFGPALVKNGRPVWIMNQLNYKDDMKAREGRQRMCIAQVGPLEYKCICCGPPENGSCGMTIDEFAQLVAAQGVQTAYNLDGGYTTKMYFNSSLVNDASKTDRPITDIIYFASAYGADSSAADQYKAGQDGNNSDGTHKGGGFALGK